MVVFTWLIGLWEVAYGVTFRRQDRLNTQNSDLDPWCVCSGNLVDVSSAQVLPPVHGGVTVRDQCPGAGKRQSPFDWLSVKGGCRQESCTYIGRVAAET